MLLLLLIQYLIPLSSSQYAMGPMFGGGGGCGGCPTPICNPRPSCGPPPIPMCPPPSPCPPQFCPPPPLCPPPPPPPMPCPPPPMPPPCACQRPQYQYYQFPQYRPMPMPYYGGGGCGGGGGGGQMVGYTMPRIPAQNDCCCGCSSQCKFRSRHRAAGAKTVDPSCNSDELKDIILEFINSDPTESKRSIQQAAEERIGGMINVICGKGEFSYIAHTNDFCQTAKDDVTCYAFKPL